MSLCCAIHHECSNPRTNSYCCKKCTRKFLGLHVPTTPTHAFNEFDSRIAWEASCEAGVKWCACRIQCSVTRSATHKRNTHSWKKFEGLTSVASTVCSIHTCKALKARGLPRTLFIHKCERCFVNIKKIAVRFHLISYTYLPSWRNVPSSSIFISLARRRYWQERLATVTAV